MENDTRSVPHINVCINENDINNGALCILEKIRPNWKKDSIHFKLLTDGITNKLVGCRPQESPEEDTVLVRIYGNKTDLLINRKAETRNIILLNKVGLAPELYATFDNGLAYRFMPGCTLSIETVKDPQIYHLVAKKMANLHKVRSEGDLDPKPCLWDKLQSFLDLVPDVFSDSTKNKKYKESLTRKSKISEEIDYLKPILINLGSPTVFSHNDLLLGNVIYTKEQNTVTFIDYEYAAFNYQAFDIGNHFAEFAGIVDCDYVKNYPSKELQLDWLKIYLTEYNEREPTADEVEKLYVQVNIFVLTSHIFWAIWALIQTEHSYIDFDFLSFASVRLNEYFARKEEFLSLRLPS